MLEREKKITEKWKKNKRYTYTVHIISFHSAILWFYFILCLAASIFFCCCCCFSFLFFVRFLHGIAFVSTFVSLHSFIAMGFFLLSIPYSSYSMFVLLSMIWWIYFMAFCYWIDQRLLGFLYICLMWDSVVLVFFSSWQYFIHLLASNK